MVIPPESANTCLNRKSREARYGIGVGGILSSEVVKLIDNALAGSRSSIYLPEIDDRDNATSGPVLWIRDSLARPGMFSLDMILVNWNETINIMNRNKDMSMHNLVIGIQILVSVLQDPCAGRYVHKEVLLYNDSVLTLISG